jgi:hypothetical protein
MIPLFTISSLHAFLAQGKVARAGIVVALLAAFWFCSTGSELLAEEPDHTPLPARDMHVWGRFSPGTWKQVRIVTESVNDRGEVTDATTTETKTTLLSVGAKSLKLKIDVTVDVGGKRFAGQSRTVEHGFFSEQPSEPGEMKLLGAAHVTIDGRNHLCQIRQVTARNGGQQQITKLYLSESVEPFVLKREITTVEANGNANAHSTSTAEVFALDRYRMQRELKSVAWERTIQRTPKGTNVTLDLTCIEVPGGIVARASKELDEKGRLMRRSMMELVDYHAELEESSGEAASDDDSTRYLSRRQARKAARRGR